MAKEDSGRIVIIPTAKNIPAWTMDDGRWTMTNRKVPMSGAHHPPMKIVALESDQRTVCISIFISVTMRGAHHPPMKMGYARAGVVTGTEVVMRLVLRARRKVGPGCP